MTADPLRRLAERLRAAWLRLRSQCAECGRRGGEIDRDSQLCPRCLWGPPPPEEQECPRCGNTRWLDPFFGVCSSCLAGKNPGLPQEVRYAAEDAINADLGLPPVWRCRCGGRPFEGKPCPRCGRTEP